MRFDGGGVVAVAAGWCLVAAAGGGCTSSLLRSDEAPTRPVSVDKDDRPKLVGDFCRPFGNFYLAVQAPALCTGLHATGSDPPPGPMRERLLGEMRRREVRGPNGILASPNTSLVLAHAYLPPAARRGDRVDVLVEVPEASDSTSLEHGWLMEARLVETAVLGNQLHTGHVGAAAAGPLLVDAVLEGDQDEQSLKRGLVLGGGIVTQERTLGLIIDEKHQTVAMSAMIGAAINGRMHTYIGGSKRGVAVPKKDSYVELEVNPRYRDNVTRYLRVIENIPLRQDPAEQAAWLNQLRPRLLDRRTAAHVALQLEALGEPAVPVLAAGLQAEDPEVRFYSAEALAYLDQVEAVPYLMEAARDESAFRWHALTALSTMSSLEAHDALAELVHQRSAETRYGAFRALQAMNPNDLLVKGEALGEVLWWHEVASTAPPLVHVARSRRPEMVVFGGPVKLDRFVALFAGRNIMIKPTGSGQLQVSRYVPGTDPTVLTCSPDLYDVVKTVVDVGGSYADVIRLLLEADRQKALPARLEFDALPRPGREYVRDARPASDQESEWDGELPVDGTPGEDRSDEPSEETLPLPLPDLFARPSAQGARRGQLEADELP